MNWLKSKVAQYILWAVLVIDIVCLIFTGVTNDQINGVVAVVFGAVAAVILVIQTIRKIIEKNDTKAD